MEVIIAKTEDKIATIVADAIQHVIVSADAPTLGLATGSSPLPVYRELIRRHRRGKLSFGTTTMFLLDEYVGLPENHPQSYRSVIRREFTDNVDVDPDAVFGPEGDSPDIAGVCRAYETRISDAHGIDLQLLGVGGDGHIGFNEPGSSLGSRTRLKTLTDQTRSDNARYFGGPDEVPRHVVTQGIGTILEARHLVLVATGAAKAAPIARTVEGPITAMVPASAMQLHPHVTILVDEPAAADLAHADYYRAVYENKPAWQSL